MDKLWDNVNKGVSTLNLAGYAFFQATCAWSGFLRIGHQQVRCLICVMVIPVTIGTQAVSHTRVVTYKWSNVRSPCVPDR
jgi:hypothetical protein